MGEGFMASLFNDKKKDNSANEKEKLNREKQELKRLNSCTRCGAEGHTIASCIRPPKPGESRK